MAKLARINCKESLTFVKVKLYRIADSRDAGQTGINCNPGCCVDHQVSPSFRQTEFHQGLISALFVPGNRKLLNAVKIIYQLKQKVMKSIISKAVMLVAIAAALISFTPNFGGEGFEILLNGKAVLQQFGKDLNTAKTLQLNSASPNDKITIRYWHCGREGKNRIVTIKDSQDRVIKKWLFKDAGTAVGDMSCSAQDILSLSKAGNTVFKIYYSSSELPEGRMLTTLIFNKNSLTARK